MFEITLTKPHSIDKIYTNVYHLLYDAAMGFKISKLYEQALCEILLNF
jgi:hypothetical protein